MEEPRVGLLRGYRGVMLPALLSALALAISLGCAPSAQELQPALLTAPQQLAPAPPTPTVQKTLARTYALNQYNRYLDGQWQGMAVASDGAVYFSSSSHAHNRAGSFFRYDPDARQLKVLSNDLSALCGEDAAKQVPQGKTHSDIVELEGSVYFATHLATYWPEHRDQYTGSHMLGYELATGQIRDLGIIRPNYTTYSAVGADPARKLLYALEVPFADAAQKADGIHLYQIDPKTAAKKDLGLVKAGGGASYHFLVTPAGDLWFSLVGDNGSLCCYRAATGKLERFDGALPLLRSPTNENEIAQPTAQGRGKQETRFISWMAPLPDRYRFLFMTSSETVQVPGTVLWLFDSRQPMDKAFTAVKHLGYTGEKNGTKVLVLGEDALRVFYLQREGNQRSGPPKDKQDFHLMSVTFDQAGRNAKISDHGLLEDQDGRRPQRICSMASDGKRLFMTGDWYILPGEKGSLSIEGLQKAPADGNFVYEDRDRGQFFAVVNLDK